jgi:hypothetical protein
LGPPVPRPGSPSTAPSTGCARSTATSPGTTNCARRPSIMAALPSTPTLRTIPGCSSDERRRRGHVATGPPARKARGRHGGMCSHSALVSRRSREAPPNRGRLILADSVGSEAIWALIGHSASGSCGPGANGVNGTTCRRHPRPPRHIANPKPEPTATATVLRPRERRSHSPPLAGHRRLGWTRHGGAVELQRRRGHTRRCQLSKSGPSVSAVAASPHPSASGASEEGDQATARGRAPKLA